VLLIEESAMKKIDESPESFNRVTRKQFLDAFEKLEGKALFRPATLLHYTDLFPRAASLNLSGSL